ncbi:two-component system, NtrC family, nitrogen regulation response regulator GlnG [Neorhodopirellula lusitana]|uniref:DNA-binding transcriptional regulator NtrC n=1 Tax=Neorhodopirellula lusitana TaxID=445327 RepID=A0ABY1QJW2_9BACT|nr:sigma-54 dependent transcriptional regulator [Neorhodopirellula lusitana]SMP73407.1 two-component system, NtrC family, nitrogen regulation response regulator GlnG [Neorhodopirellula lusitana]
MTKQTILVVDDEPSICWAFEKMLTGEGHEVVSASSAEEGIRLAAKHLPDLVVLDVRLPKEDGISAMPKFLKATDNAPVIVITAFGDLETAVAAVKQGATDYLTKPFKLEVALRACRAALKQSANRATPVTTQPMELDSTVLVGTSPAMHQVFRQIALVAESDLSVLITGETGTGKELVAAAIHRHSLRADKPYLPIAPVALNPELIESELFGHVKGAFTGASEDRAGLFERAEGGTVLLDEIGDLPLATQVKLLRVLEQGQFSRVGDVRPRTANVRILAATNAELHEAVGRGDFREDLFHRLTGMQIHLPPLRDRCEDIEPLCRHFLAAMKYAAADTAIDDGLVAELAERPWHGNIRELRNAVEHAAVVARGRPLTIDDFPAPSPGRDDSVASSSQSLEGVIGQWTREVIEASSGKDLQTLHAQFLAATEPTLFQIALQHTHGNRAKAAEMLGIHRGTLRDRLRSYGLDDAN